MPDTPLNPDALDETALANLIAWKSLPFGATQFVKLDANAAHKVIELLRPHLAVAQSVAQKLTDAEWQEFQAIPDQGYSHRAWVDARIAEHVAVAQPVVNSVEELDALPIGSVIIDKHGDVGLIDRDGTIEKCVQFVETIAMSIGYTAKHFLPARVLYRPGVNDV